MSVVCGGLKTAGADSAETKVFGVLKHSVELAQPDIFQIRIIYTDGLKLSRLQTRSYRDRSLSRGSVRLAIYNVLVLSDKES